MARNFSSSAGSAPNEKHARLVRAKTRRISSSLYNGVHELERDAPVAPRDMGVLSGQGSVLFGRVPHLGGFRRIRAFRRHRAHGGAERDSGRAPQSDLPRDRGFAPACADTMGDPRFAGADRGGILAPSRRGTDK